MYLHSTVSTNVIYSVSNIIFHLVNSISTISRSCEINMDMNKLKVSIHHLVCASSRKFYNAAFVAPTGEVGRGSKWNVRLCFYSLGESQKFIESIIVHYNILLRGPHWGHAPPFAMQNGEGGGGAWLLILLALIIVRSSHGVNYTDMSIGLVALIFPFLVVKNLQAGIT